MQIHRSENAAYNEPVVSLRRTLLLLTGLAAIACNRGGIESDRAQAYRGSGLSLPSPPSLALREVSAQAYVHGTWTSDLPDDVRAGLARHLGEKQLKIAQPGEPYSHGCLVEPGLPRERLVAAAINERFAIVQYEHGGFAPTHITVVFVRMAGGQDAAVIWTGLAVPRDFTPPSFLAAIRSGELWPYPMADLRAATLWNQSQQY